MIGGTILIGFGFSPVIGISNFIGGGAVNDSLLLETGDFFLLEDGCKLLLDRLFLVDEFSNNITDEGNNLIII